MGQYTKSKYWQHPWGYGESIAIVLGLIVIGIMLQLTIGVFNFYLLAKPVNYIFFGIIILICTLLGGAFKQNNFVKWLSGASLSVTLVLALLVLTIIMGLTPQKSDEVDSGLSLGLNTMTRNWSFVLIYFVTLISLGTLIVRRLFSFNLRNYAFYLNHIGLWLLLIASGLGYADMERYVMYVREGETEWRVYDSQNNVKELPIAIQLNNFDMDVYPPKLAIIDRITGDVQPSNNPQYFQIDKDLLLGELNGWKVEVKEYIHEAVRSSDSTYREVPMPGATPAAFVVLKNSMQTYSGWICGGNQAQLYMTLPISDEYSVVMTTTEPRMFMSDVAVYTKTGEVKNAIIEVNKPLRIGSWTIYQYGYDNNAGKLSSYSSFELVYDPWIIPVYIGIIMMMFGGVCMLWIGNKTEEVEYDVE